MEEQQTHTPPRWLIRFFRWYCHPSYAEDIEGDLCERFGEYVADKGPQQARLRFALEVLLLFRPGIVRPLSKCNNTLIHPTMFKHNLLITYRSFLRNKSTFLINLIGLSTGLACVLLIYLWVQDELSVDKFHENDEQLYQVMSNFRLAEDILTWDYTPGPLAEGMLDELPEVEAAASLNSRYFKPEGVLFYRDKNLVINGLFASKNFFSVFSYNLIQGNKEEVLSDKSKIVISEALAQKLFQSSKNAVGKTVEWSYIINENTIKNTFEVSGIFKSPPENATKHFDVVINYDLLVEADFYAGDWSGDYAETYLVLKKHTDLDKFNDKIAKFMESKREMGASFTLFIQQYSKRYLYDNYEEGILVGGRISYVRLFSLVAILILLIACINFTNLSTAQASLKLKEIGVKKAIGARRRALIVQLLGESILITVVALLIALVGVLLLLPQFNLITGKSLQLVFDTSFLLSALGIIILTGVLAGIYPAFYFSGFNPVSILKGKHATYTSEQSIRKLLVIFQFSLSIIFIVGVLVVDQQMGYIQAKNLGYNRDNVICFQVGSENNNPEVFVSALKDLPGVLNASNMVRNILDGTDLQGGYSWRGVESDKDVIFKAPRIGYDVIETLGMRVVAGRTYSKQYKDDESKIVINESARKFMQLENPIGKTIERVGMERQIIGVVEDFHYGSIHHKVEPLIFRFRSYGRDVLVRIQAGTEKATIGQIEALYRKFHPKQPFDYSFLDQDYQALYEAETRVAALSKYFSAIAIIISCLGLFGLAAFTAERRQKEIGIRKVLGASVVQLVQLLSMDFTKMVLIAILIGIPVSYLISHRWLESFAYKIDLQGWYFVVAAIITLLIAWLTVSFQAFKAARINPVESLRDE